jgi:hypothetical protein
MIRTVFDGVVRTRIMTWIKSSQDFVLQLASFTAAQRMAYDAVLHLLARLLVAF